MEGFIPVQTDFPELKNDNILRAARGDSVKRVPVWVKRQAGRYLPEYRVLSKEHGFLKICRTPELACEVTLQPLRRFDLDASIIFSDILVVPEAMGFHLIDTDKGPGFSNPLKDPSELDRVNVDVDVTEALGYVFDAITLTRKRIDGQCPLLGFSGAPLTLMNYMIEGGGSSTFMKSRRWLYSYPEASHKLLQMLTDVIVRYLVNQVRAGAQMLQLFEAHGVFLTQKQFKTFGLPYYIQILNRVRQTLTKQGVPHVPMNIFAKDCHYALKDLSESGYDAISLDWSIDPAVARSQTGPNITLQGNLDPCALYGSKESINAAVKEMIGQFGTHRYIANLGHGIYLDTDPDHMEAFVDAIHEHSEELINRK